MLSKIFSSSSFTHFICFDFPIETSSENKEKPSRPSRYRPRIVPAEPEPTSRRGIPEESPEDRGIPAPRISKKTLRTSTNVERSIHNRPPINEEETEEEE